ncbi:cell division regulator GpsB [Vagococcus carniphilus]|uniref:Cell cycle protein GpsB n=1 Tax=Vagococcus carniphilus TaxID=218144 RepID=A0A430AWC8_9ENTE|nr:cell division regulator GpsB [Vagococcus carniphilus]MDT2831604.1 cell division regulator GpsB [Vagococcus carniphilus]MDT2840488.1 cell division regulator GpsB [Vagococcus carniphilus]MDT2855146.1 cell division regulator GpsB [Vagococcus carniphilus]QNN72184.1 cell division regulator GpsB [Vagococcus carniphilus]RSU12371.1 cell division protein DivIVA [Vagococcus carniphilus]
MAKLVYSARDILQKEFKTKVRGYDPIEVDEFLDNVIKDYEAYNQELLALKEENHRLVNKVDQLTQNQATLSRMKQDAPKTTAVTNFDILKRLSNLEKHVFGSKLEESPASANISENAKNTLNNAAQKVLEDNEDLDATRRF